MPHDDSNLPFALMQTLENYQRCGVKWIGRKPLSQLPQHWLDAVADAVQPIDARHSVVSQPVEKSPQVVSQIAAQPPSGPLPVAQVRMPESPYAPSASDLSIESNAPPVWSTPSLNDQQRLEALSQIDSKIKACRLCSEICRYRQQTVFGVGPIRPTVCFMGEAPGADEDRLGEPFVGRAGQLLTKIIQAMTLRREDVYILNALKCRPPNNRTPLPDEIANCLPNVEMQLEMLQPKYIVCLGAVAVRSLLNSTTSIGKLRGRFYQYRGAKVVVTYHPSYLLRNESAKKYVWEDMQMLMRELGLKRE